jgi:hypothetical protein
MHSALEWCSGKGQPSKCPSSVHTAPMSRLTAPAVALRLGNALAVARDAVENRAVGACVAVTMVRKMSQRVAHFRQLRDAPL